MQDSTETSIQMAEAPMPPAVRSGLGPKRGLGSKKKKDEKFTEKKNREGQLAIKERIKADLAKDKVFLLDMDEEEFLKQYIRGEEVNRRPLEVTVSINVIDDLATATTGFVASQKVEVREEDSIMLANVIKLQAKAKVAKARATTPVESQPINDPFVDKTVKHLSQTVRSVGTFLDQLGIVENQKQLIVPKLNQSPTWYDSYQYYAWKRDTLCPA